MADKKMVRMVFRVAGIARWQCENGIKEVAINSEFIRFSVASAEEEFKQILAHVPMLSLSSCLNDKSLPKLLEVTAKLSIVKLVPVSEISFDPINNKYKKK